MITKQIKLVIAAMNDATSNKVAIAYIVREFVRCNKREIAGMRARLSDRETCPNAAANTTYDAGCTDKKTKTHPSLIWVFKFDKSVVHRILVEQCIEDTYSYVTAQCMYEDVCPTPAHCG